MQKGYVRLFSIIFFSVIAILLAGNASAYVCTDGFSATECVCGHTPNSGLGYGQVIIGASTYSCNNIADGICPEDFSNGTVTGNCSSCPDADCSVGGTGPVPAAFVTGYVRDKNGNPIQQVLIVGSPIKWDPAANLDRNTTTNAPGFYSSNQFITGTYYFKASKDGYDTQLIKATVVRGMNITINFTLQDGTCHEDCTNSYNRCNAACDGVTFGNGTSKCQFFNNEIKLLCNDKEKGTLVRLTQAPYAGNSTYSYFAQCCEDAPQQLYYSKLDSVNSNKIQNIITIEKIAIYNGVTVRIVTAYWKE